MYEDIITRNSSVFKELRHNIVQAIQAVDILIDTHRPSGRRSTSPARRFAVSSV